MRIRKIGINDGQKRGRNFRQGKLAGGVGAREGKLAGQCGALATTVGRQSEMRWVMGCRWVMSRGPVESLVFRTGKDEEARDRPEFFVSIRAYPSKCVRVDVT